MLDLLWGWFFLSLTFLVLNVASRSIHGRLTAARGPALSATQPPPAVAPSCDSAAKLGHLVLRGIAMVHSDRCHVAAVPLETIGPNGMAGFKMIVASDQVFDQVLRPHIESYFGGK